MDPKSLQGNVWQPARGHRHRSLKEEVHPRGSSTFLPATAFDNHFCDPSEGLASFIANQSLLSVSGHPNLHASCAASSTLPLNAYRNI